MIFSNYLISPHGDHLSHFVATRWCKMQITNHNHFLRSDVGLTFLGANHKSCLSSFSERLRHLICFFFGAEHKSRFVLISREVMSSLIRLQLGTWYAAYLCKWQHPFLWRGKRQPENSQIIWKIYFGEW